MKRGRADSRYCVMHTRGEEGRGLFARKKSRSEICQNQEARR